jgi:hypothetical protein
MGQAIQLLVDALTQALSGHKCVSGWLGYGHVLFLGFGDSTLSAFGADGHRVKPPYKLESNFADWSVQRGGSIAEPENDTAILDRAIQELIGQPVKKWELGDDFSLRIDFGDSSQLRVIPWPEEDVTTDAWLASLADGWIIAVSCGRKIARVPRNLPIREWFTGK